MPRWIHVCGIVLALLVVSVPGAAWPARGTTVGPLVDVATTLTASEDAYLQAQAEDANVGTADRLVVSIGGTRGEVWSVIKFDLSSLPSRANITSATLSLTGATDIGLRNQAIKINLAPVAWTEDTVAWNTFGGLRGDVVSQINVDGRLDRAYTVEVSDTVRSWVLGSMPNNGFLLAMPEGASGDLVTHIYAREKAGSSAPQLLINYQAEPTPTPAPSATATRAGGGASPSATPTATATATATPLPTVTPTPSGPTRVYLPAVHRKYPLLQGVPTR